MYKIMDKTKLYENFRAIKIKVIKEKMENCSQSIKDSEQNIREKEAMFEVQEKMLEGLEKEKYPNPITPSDIDLIIRSIEALYENLNTYDDVDDKETFKSIQEDLTILEDKLILINKMREKE